MGPHVVKQVNEPFIVERRRNARLRSIYEDAQGRVTQLFHGQSDWIGSPIDYLAQRLMHDTYPDLNGNELRTLVTAIEHHVRTEFSRA